MSNKKRQLPVRLLLLISFFEGGAVMVIELLGAKIIAPYYGTSLYVWSSVLGVTLGALALGYFAGGHISRKYPGPTSLFVLLLIGAFFTLLSPLLAPQILLLTDPLGVRMGSLVSVLLYLLPPVACMGAVSPIVTQLINQNADEAGKSAGTVYSISTVGGILATLLAGFYLIPELGIKLTSYLTGGALASAGLLYFIWARKTVLAVVSIGVAIVAMAFDSPAKDSDNVRVVYHSTGILGEWTVLDLGQWKVEGNDQIERKLLLNGIDQKYTQIGFESLSLWRYPHKIGAYSSMKPPGSKALLLGMGGGSIAFEILAMGHELDIVEMDERIRFIAEEYFKYDPSSSDLYIDDARCFIRQSKEKYDFVVVDLVLGEVQPHHVFTLEGFEDIKKVLNPGAIVVINFQGNIESPMYSLGPKCIYKTLEAAGFNVSHYSPPTSKEGKLNLTKDIFFLASLEEQDYTSLMEDLRYNEWFPYEDFGYENLISDKPVDLEGAFVLVDDKPKLELINAPAMLNWRKNKVQQNLKKMLNEGVHIF
ncbi:MAG: fused MFS/spermidine synthase [Bacteroidota bacterium]